MKIGAIFPQVEMSPDNAAVRAWTEAAEGLGYSHIMAFDHVLGAGLENRPGWNRPYNSESPFREPFLLFAYMAAITSRIEFVTGVIILPQRQTALVAKQAADVDLFSEGRLRLGVGIGWNDVEYTSLNENFRNRGKRMEEQIEVLRRLFAEPVVDFKGKHHHIPEAGINPLPAQQQIPIWIGGTAQPALERAGRMADGWFPQVQPGERLEEMKSWVAEGARQAGRDSQPLPMEGRIPLATTDPSEWQSATDAWREAGATHLTVNTMGKNLTVDQHIDLLRRYKEKVD